MSKGTIDETDPQMNLKTPYALNKQGNLTPPTEASKDSIYYCPSCEKPLIFKRGDIKIPHFAHYPEFKHLCSQESIEHQTAKRLIKAEIEKWKSGKCDAPTLQRECSECNWEKVTHRLPDKVESATLEYNIDGYRVDVALIDTTGTAIAAVEIFHTHRIDKDKASTLSIPFIELKAEDIIEEPNLWITINHSGLNNTTCPTCKSFRERVKAIAEQTNVQFDEGYYTPGIDDCYRCHKEILIFKWSRGGQNLSDIWNRPEPMGHPRPRTIEYRYTHTTGTSYWANTCPYCKAVQGAFYEYQADWGY